MRCDSVAAAASWPSAAAKTRRSRSGTARGSWICENRLSSRSPQLWKLLPTACLVSLAYSIELEVEEMLSLEEEAGEEEEEL